MGSLTLNAKPDAIWSLVAYPMSKAALNMLAIQYARAFPGWRVNSVTPGLTLTEFTGHPPTRWTFRRSVVLAGGRWTKR